MPLIHIKSLPFDTEVDVESVLETLSHDVSEQAGIGLEHVTATWEFLHPGHYAAGGVAQKLQPANTHPLLVDLLVPDFNSRNDVERLLTCVATSLAARTGVPRHNIFIHGREARSGMVFDRGKIRRWS